MFASTATVYGLTPHVPVAEDVEPKPVTAYDTHKLEAEQRLSAASRDGALDGIALRLSNVYGRVQPRAVPPSAASSIASSIAP